MTDASEDHDCTVSIGNRTITNFRFADDIDGSAGKEEELVGRQHQAMDWLGVRQPPEGSGEQRKMEETGCEVIRSAPATLADEVEVKGKEDKLFSGKPLHCSCIHSNGTLHRQQGLHVKPINQTKRDSGCMSAIL